MDQPGMIDLAHHHYGVSVSDLDTSIAWYGDMLGFTVERRFAVPPACAVAAMLRHGALRVELFQVDQVAPLPDARREPHADLATIGNKHPAFAVPDLAALIAGLEARGADLAFIVPPHLGRACFVRDPDGNLIEFVERRPEPAPGES
jgi:catechol 2,3-dioxygenase-like lactoylglutathione lyase family enzyme